MAEINLEHINRLTVFQIIKEIDELDRIFDRYLNYRDPIASHRRFFEAANITANNLWTHKNKVLVNQLRSIEHSLTQEGEEDLPHVEDVIQEADRRGYSGEDELEGYHRDERFDLWADDAWRKIHTPDIEKNLMDKQDVKIREMVNSPEKRLAERRLNERRKRWLYSHLNVGHIKRLLFAETIKEAQLAQATYLEMAGYYFCRWTLSPTHPMGDICDVYARHTWLSNADMEEYNKITGRTDFGGVVPIADLHKGLLFPEIEDWSDGRIASLIRQYSRHRKIDTRRKRAGWKPPHAMCKCMLVPILESRV
jgi:hypothetical protein